MSTYTRDNIKIGTSNIGRLLLGSGHSASTVTDGDSEVTGYDIGSDEIWNVHLGKTHVYSKEKTFENYWKAHNLISTNVQASDGTTYMSSEVLSTLNLEDDIKDKDLIIKPVKDLEEHIYSTANGYVEGLAYHVRPVNKEAFWTPIKKWFANNYVSCGFFDYMDGTNFYRKGRFGGSNLYGEVTFNIDNAENTVGSRGGGYNALYYPFNDSSKGSQITKLTLHVKDTTQNLAWSSMNSAFCGLNNCEELVYDGTPNNPTDVSDCFTRCKFSTWPRNLINYQYIKISNYFIDGGSGIKVIPLCSLSDDREAACNTLKVNGNQVFNCNWTDIMPKCDCSSGLLTYFTFGWNTKGTNARIYGINQSYSFDGDKGLKVNNNSAFSYLPNLDADSIRYLFDNLTNIITDDYEDNYLHNFLLWYGLSGNPTITRSSITTEGGNKFNLLGVNYHGISGTLKVTISGLSDCSTITLAQTADGNTLFTEDGDYDLEFGTDQSLSGTDGSGFAFNTDKPVTITLRKPNSKGYSLYVPTEWKTMIDNNLLTFEDNFMHDFALWTVSDECTVTKSTINLKTTLTSSKTSVDFALYDAEEIIAKHLGSVMYFTVSGMSGYLFTIKSASESATYSSNDEGQQCKFNIIDEGGSSQAITMEIWCNGTPATDIDVDMTITLSEIAGETDTNSNFAGLVSDAKTKGWTIYLGDELQ